LESGVRSQESGVRSQESGVRSQEYGRTSLGQLGRLTHLLFRVRKEPDTVKMLKMKIDPAMCMKAKATLTKCLVKCTAFTRKSANCATIDKNPSDFFAEMHRAWDRSRSSGTRVPPVRGDVARASCPCRGMARMAMLRGGVGAGRSRASGRDARATICRASPLCARNKIG